MTYTELQDRFFELTDAIKDTSGTAYFTVGERICLHQERASVMRAMEELYDRQQAFGNHPNPEEVAIPMAEPRYRLPNELEEKRKQFNINNA